MILAIVGSEKAKFTTLGEIRAKEFIARIISDPICTGVSSGHCHLGGIDIWAEEIAKKFKRELFVYAPASRNWSNGYKQRNIDIANKSDKVWCISVDTLPEGFSGMKFSCCYHCERNAQIPYPNHVKSGGCWTMYYAIGLGKQGSLYVVKNNE